MSRKIIGVTVGTPLPKPDWLQTDPKKGDYIKNKPTGIGQGKDGLTPHIGENGNWWIGDTDTGVKAGGSDGAMHPLGIIINFPEGNTSYVEYDGSIPESITIPIGFEIRNVGFDSAWLAILGMYFNGPAILNGNFLVHSDHAETLTLEYAYVFPKIGEIGMSGGNAESVTIVEPKTGIMRHVVRTDDGYTMKTTTIGESGGDVPSSGEGLTTAQITALDELFKIAAYTADASAKYAAFRQAFGLEGSGGEEPDIPVEPDTPSTDWELVHTIPGDQIISGMNSSGLNADRASYSALDIPAEEGYTYRVTVDYNGSDALNGGAVIYSKNKTVLSDGTQSLSNYAWMELDENNAYEFDVTSETITDVSQLGWIVVTYKQASPSNARPSSTFNSVTITRKAVGAVEPDEPDVPSDGWETVRVLYPEDIKVGTAVYGGYTAIRASYNDLDIPVEAGYTYRVETETKYSVMYHGIVLWDKDFGTPNGSNQADGKLYDVGWGTQTTEPVTVDVVASNANIKDINKNMCMLVAYKYVDERDMEADCIIKVTITRKAVS